MITTCYTKVMSSRLPYIIILIVVAAIGWFVFAGYHYLKVTNFRYAFSGDGEIVATTTNSIKNPTPPTDSTTPEITTGEVIGSELPAIRALVPVSETKMVVGTLTGQIYLLDLDKKSLLVDDLNLRQIGESGLVNLILEVDFAKNGVYYAHYVYRDDSGDTRARVEKRQADLTGEMKSNRQLAVMLTGLPAGLSSNGAGLVKVKNQFWFLFGDFERAVLAGDKSVFNGKVIKLPSLTTQLSTDQIVGSGLRNPQSTAVIGSDLYFVDTTLPNLSRLFKLESGLSYGWPVEPNCQGGDAVPLFCDSQSITGLTARTVDGGEQLIWSTSAGNIVFFDIQSRKVVNRLSTPYGQIGHLLVLGNNLIVVTDNRGRGGGRPGDNQVVVIDLMNLK